MPFVEPNIIPFIEGFIDKRFHKDVIVVLSVSMTMPIMFFIIIPNIKHLVG